MGCIWTRSDLNLTLRTCYQKSYLWLQWVHRCQWILYWKKRILVSDSKQAILRNETRTENNRALALGPVSVMDYTIWALLPLLCHLRWVLEYRLRGKVKEVWINGADNQWVYWGSPSQASTPAVKPQQPPGVLQARMAPGVNVCVCRVRV